MAFRQAVASWKFTEAAAAGERLLPIVTTQRRWIDADELRDGLVFAKLHLRDAAGARRSLEALARSSRRPATDLRSQLLASYVELAETAKPTVAQAPRP